MQKTTICPVPQAAKAARSEAVNGLKGKIDELININEQRLHLQRNIKPRLDVWKNTRMI
jgi:hypothetical protein